jgi:hypothetical protein
MCSIILIKHNLMWFCYCRHYSTRILAHTITMCIWRRIIHRNHIWGETNIVQLFHLQPCCHNLVVMWSWWFGLVTGFTGLLQFLITIQANAVYNIVQFSTARTKSSRSVVSSPLLRYLIPMADISFPEFPNCSRATATATLHSPCTQLSNSTPTVKEEIRH